MTQEEQDRVDAFHAVLVQLVTEYPSSKHPEALRILESYRSIGSRFALHRVAAAKSNAPLDMINASYSLIFG